MGNKEFVKVFHTSRTKSYSENYDKIFRKNKEETEKKEPPKRPERPKPIYKTESGKVVDGPSKLTKQQEDLLRFKHGTLVKKETEEN